MSVLRWVGAVAVATALALGIWKIGNSHSSSNANKPASSAKSAEVAANKSGGGGSQSNYCADAKVLFADAKDFLQNVGGDYTHEVAAEAYAQADTLAKMAKDAPSEIASATHDVASAYSAVKIELQAIHFNPADPSNGPELAGIMQQFQLSLANVKPQNTQMYAYIQRVCGFTLADATPAGG